MTRNGNIALFRRFLLVGVLVGSFAPLPAVTLAVAKKPLGERIQVVGGIRQWDPALRKGRGVVVLRDSVSQKTLGVQIGRNVLVGRKSFTVAMTRQGKIVLTHKHETVALTPAEVPKDQSRSSPDNYAEGNWDYPADSMEPELPDSVPDDSVIYAEEEERWNGETDPQEGNPPTWEEDRYDTYAPEDYERSGDPIRYEDEGYEGGYEDGYEDADPYEEGGYEGGYEDAGRYEDGGYEDAGRQEDAVRYYEDDSYDDARRYDEGADAGSESDEVRANPFERGWGPGE